MSLMSTFYDPSFWLWVTLAPMLYGTWHIKGETKLKYLESIKLIFEINLFRYEN